MLKNIYIVHKDIDFTNELMLYLKEKVNYNIVDIKIKLNLLERILCYIFKFVNLDFSIVWTYSFLKKISLEEENSVVIIFDSGKGKDIALLLKRIYKKIPMIFWYWNKINDEKLLNKIKKSFKKNIYTFDKKDAEKYKINYLPQFYWYFEEEKVKSLNIYEVMFVGYSKGREKSLLELKTKLEENNLETFFHIVSDKHIYDRFKKKNKLLSYSEIKETIKKSKCILEIVNPGQRGLTLRAFEAMFFKKKLITNNSEIKNYEFYNKNNVFLLHEDKNLLEFLNLKLDNSYEKKIKKYLAENWLEKIIKEYTYDNN